MSKAGVTRVSVLDLPIPTNSGKGDDSSSPSLAENNSAVINLPYGGHCLNQASTIMYIPWTVDAVSLHAFEALLFVHVLFVDLWRRTGTTFHIPFALIFFVIVVAGMAEFL